MLRSPAEYEVGPQRPTGCAAARALDESPILEARDVSVVFKTAMKGLGPSSRLLTAVDSVSIAIQRGRTLGLVGESGSGKTTLGRACLGLVPIATGSIHFRGSEISRLPKRQLRKLRAEMQVIFQDPVSSFDPRKRISWSLCEPLRAHSRASGAEMEKAGLSALARVGLEASIAQRFPLDLSGGQLQRVAIARALTMNPSLVLCDEPTSALDVSAQAQVLNVLQDLQEELGLSYLFVTHDLAVVASLAHSVAVMYLGQVIEAGPAASVVKNPLHPYTTNLVTSVPNADADGMLLTSRRTRAEMADSTVPPPGCRYHPRCPFATAVCSERTPALERLPDGTDRSVACHHWRRIAAEGS
ncbi:MAG: peptide ABC transporter ATP-binding protein [Acidobacteria bacterium]|nr:MAG: peptide ABC transporter ATP-binding protein [Acidobacteriota bacterium]